MEVLYRRCAGLDVHKDTVVAGLRLAEAGSVKTEIRSFATTTPGLLALSAWLGEHGCTHVAMEATGIYWKPVWHRVHASNRSDSRARSTTTRLGLETGACLSADGALKLPNLA